MTTQPGERTAQNRVRHALSEDSPARTRGCEATCS
jgi:hypothetical protein